eukprot:jgi/Mesen1/8534/ME000484S07926
MNTHGADAAVQATNDDATVSKLNKKQILSLGAGFDTTFFQLLEDGLTADKYVEVDFVEVTSRKVHAIAAHEELRSKLDPDCVLRQDKGELVSGKYAVVPADLRDTAALDAALSRAGLDPSIPTLILAECVLIYMDPASSRQLVKWAAQKFPTSAFAIYEQRAEALDMDAIYNRSLDLADIKRIERLEIFDEFEEWHIMQEHYCIAYGINDEQASGGGHLAPPPVPRLSLRISL